MNDFAMHASVTGSVERVNRLISVHPLYARYTPQVGDLVVGRINEVGSKRWSVDIGARQDAVLMLSSINLPGGILRRKLESDELQMRNFFNECDLLVAEVQSIFSEGSASLHTRSLKFGKLRNGTFVAVPPRLVLRSKSQLISLVAMSHTVDVILGVNGYLWVSKHTMPFEQSSSAIGGARSRLEEEASEAIYSNVNDPMDAGTREGIARVAACIRCLAQGEVRIDAKSLKMAVDASLMFW